MPTTRYSRPQTPKALFSTQTWEQGPSAFFSQGVPFSYGIGSILAERVLQLFAALRAQKKDYSHTDAMRALEIGAGLGYLSKHCLDKIKPPYEWHVSDCSPALVTHWQSRNVFSGYANTTLHQLDLSAPFSWPTDLDLVLMSYVLDSTPTCHVAWENGHLYEWVIHTEQPTTKNDTLATDKNHPWVAPRNSATCQETWERIPLSESPFLTQEDQNFLEKFCRDTHTKNTLFNYTPVIRQRLPEILAALSPLGMIALHDFGYQDPLGALQKTDLCTQFGAIQAYPIHFPLLRWLCQQHGAHFWVSPAPEGESALAILSRAPLPESATEYDAQFPQAHILQEILTTSPSEKATDIQDYAILCHYANNSTSKEEEAYWLQKALALYPDIAIPTYSQYADLLIQSGKPEDAKTLLQEAHDRFPLDPTLAVSLANSHIRAGEYDPALALLKEAVPRLDGNLAKSSTDMYTLLKNYRGRIERAPALS